MYRVRVFEKCYWSSIHINSTVRTRDDDVQDSSVCVRGFIHMLHQSEGIKEQLELQGGRIRGVIQINAEITGDDQLRVECCHGFQQISKFIEKRWIWGQRAGPVHDNDDDGPAWSRKWNAEELKNGTMMSTDLTTKWSRR